MDTFSVPLSNGMVSLIDADDWETVHTFTRTDGKSISLRPSSVNWRCQKNRNYFYAMSQRRFNRETFVLTLHRLVMDCPADLIIDHIGDTLDNRKCNLRFADNSTNGMHQKAVRGGTSQFRGVYKRSMPNCSKPWVAQIGLTICGKKQRIKVGYFADEIAAAKAYDEAAIQLYREFAVLNFPACEASK